MKDNRPVNLDLTTIRFPLIAITSIVHRISGVIIFLALPFFLWALADSLASASRFAAVKATLATGFTSVLVYGVLCAVAYHVIAGVKHLLGDLGFGEELSCARIAAKLVLVLSAVVFVLLGIFLWA